jgi:hypothetical protein
MKLKEKAVYNAAVAIRNFFREHHELLGLALILPSYHIITWIAYWYDETTAIPETKYFLTPIVAGFKLLFFHLLAINGIRFTWKALWNYYSTITPNDQTQFQRDFIDAFNQPQLHRLWRILLFIAVYFAYFVAAMAIEARMYVQ